MYSGFYTLGSAMLSQRRNLETISSNMVNIDTPGYKNKNMTSRTFNTEMLIRTHTRDKAHDEDIGMSSRTRIAEHCYNDMKQGVFRETGSPYNVAIEGDGFFKVKKNDGSYVYTRNGAWERDSDGDLSIRELGKIMSDENNSIYIEDDDFMINEKGEIVVHVFKAEDSKDEGFQADGFEENENRDETIGKIHIAYFDSEDIPTVDEKNAFRSDAEIDARDGEESIIHQGMIEKSNVDMSEEMVKMISSQRAVQSASQLMKMYDRLMEKSVSDIGRV